MAFRKQLSVVLPEPLIRAIKQRASRRGQSITAYITRLVQQDLETDDERHADAAATPLVERLEALEQRVMSLEQREL